MMRMIFKYCMALMMLSFVSSCAHYKDIPYFQNSTEFDGTGKEFLYDLTVKPKDELTIFVFSPNDRNSASIFNMGDNVTLDITKKNITTRGGKVIHPYIVDNEGNIDYPLIGSVHVSNLTLDSISSHIKKLISPYFQPEADILVNTLINNFDITVTGEVKHPNTFEVTRNKITVLEALAMAGDMTIYGKRDNVKILRELSDGTYEVHELDMRDANILNSPYYYLQQRDIVYVEPNEAMAQNSKIGQTTQLWVRGAAITISLGSLLYRVLQ